ncbi:hypothetical protein KZZ07_05180 [Mameliella sp. CS4]|uniref:hypothetical protein n=1 Tax=Mameliella sp. CS4 TaxID=2862329 RepID=UPI001C604BEE|nr:hypothetical protein [Mameliella sp. CS4]MBW4981933.1 hypothetical protein [Mameliella sp. CS4]
MTHQTTDPYLRQHEARYSPEERIDERLSSSRRSAGSALGIAVGLILAIGIVALIAFGPGATTDPVAPAEAPAAVDPVTTGDPTAAPSAVDPAQGSVPPEAETDGPVAPTAPAVPAE